MSRPFLLLVDDSEEMGLIVTSLGRRAACDVNVCPDAESAWEALPRRRPDLVLLDVNLPGVSGPDWLRRVRAAPEFAGLRVALYTHWGLPSDIAAGLNAGADFMFDKDLASRPADWQRRLSEILASGPVAGGEAQLLGAWPNVAGSSSMNKGEVVAARTAWIAAFNQVFHLPSLRRVTGEVFQAVLRRALTRAFGSRILPEEREAWIAPDGSGLDANRLPQNLAPNAPVLLASCLAEQMGRLLGADASAAFRQALTAALPGLSEVQSWP